MLNSDAEDWPISISLSREPSNNAPRWEVRYVSGEKKSVNCLDDLRKLIGEANFKQWRIGNG